MFEIDKKLNIYAKGMIADNLSVKDNHREWLENLISKFQEISGLYRMSLSGDGKLIGVEKNSLQLNLENFFITLLSFVQKHKTDSSDTSIPSGEGKEIYIQFPTGSTWQVSGGIGQRKLKDVSHFGNWFNQNFSGALKEFVDIFGKSQIDGVITEEEKKEVLVKISNLILEVILILTVIEHSDITN